MLTSMLDTLAPAYESSRHRETLAMLWQDERWFDTPRQRRAAENTRQAFCEAGLSDARLVPFAADGRARYQDWTTALAWSCSAARLTCGAEVLADRARTPTAVVQWSGPLANTEAGIVDGDAMDVRASGASVDGRFVLTAKPPREMKDRLRGARALGVLSDFLGTNIGYDENTTRWCNTWADGRDGWYVRACDSVLPGFCLTPATGQRLRTALREKPELKVQAFCESRLYAGESCCVTAVLPGADPSREIWIIGHAAEEGANDNCSGVSTLIEAARMLQGLVLSGRLARPRFSIRFVATVECLGTAAFGTLESSARRRALACLNVDSVGTANPLTLAFGPLSAPSFGWICAGVILDAIQKRAPLHSAAISGGFTVTPRLGVPREDNMLADPLAGVPTTTLGQVAGIFGYHSSNDTPEHCTTTALAGSALAVATWAYLMAGLDNEKMEALAPAAHAWASTHLCGTDDLAFDSANLRRWATAQAWRDLSRWPVTGCEDHARRYATAECATTSGGSCYSRRVWGMTTLDTLPETRARAFSRWSEWQAAAWYWTRPDWSLETIENFTRAEVGQVPEGAIKVFLEACCEAGLATRVR
ncbi:MAG TPA: M28 family peptidase [Planctomycetota bacterium]|jgi:hypothetical protein